MCLPLSLSLFVDLFAADQSRPEVVHTEQTQVIHLRFEQRLRATELKVFTSR